MANEDKMEGMSKEMQSSGVGAAVGGGAGVAAGGTAGAAAGV